MKRFYKLVSASCEEGGYSIQLDGRSVKTPAKKTLLVFNEQLANDVVKEWAAQDKHIVPDTMPITQLLSTKIDRIAQERTVMSETILNYLDTDLICYLADHPPEAFQAQEEVWAPLRERFNKRFDVTLKTTDALSAIKQEAKAHESVRKFVEELDDHHFTIAQLVTSLSGSLILALDFVDHALSANELFEATFVDEIFKAKIYNEELHGGDPAQIKAHHAFKRDIAGAALYLKALKA